MAEYLILRRSPAQIYEHLQALKFPVLKSEAETNALYVEEGSPYRPAGSTLFECPLVLMNDGGPGKYWWGPMRWGIGNSSPDEPTTMIPDHSLGNLIYRPMYKSKRCVVLATGFVYAQKGKTTYYTHFRDERIVPLAAVYSTGKGSDGNCFALVNVPPNKELALRGFNNMPALLTTTSELYRWLRPTASLEDLDKCLHPVTDSQLEAMSVHMLDEIPRKWVG